MKLVGPYNVRWLVEAYLEPSEIEWLYEGMPIHDAVFGQLDTVEREIYVYQFELYEREMKG